MKKPAKTIGVFEFMRLFPDEVAARDFFEERRWQGQPTCPKCGGCEKITSRKRAGYYWCGDCRENFTAKTGTVMECSNVKIRQWLFAIYLLVTARKGISSLQLSKEIDVTQKTAWFMLQRIREACGGDVGKLSGIVEVDETYIGGKEQNKHKARQLKVGGGAVGKAAVMGMRERGGRVKAKPISTADAATVRGEIDAGVEVGATLCTDDAPVYRGMGGLFYKHERVNHSAKEYVNGMAHTNGIESVWAVLKRGHDGVYHQMSVKHLHRYVDEFTFRLNDGNVGRDTIDRIGSLCDRFCGKRIRYAELVAER